MGEIGLFNVLPLFQPKHLICPDFSAQNTTNLHRSYTIANPWPEESEKELVLYAVLPKVSDKSLASFASRISHNGDYSYKLHSAISKLEPK